MDLCEGVFVHFIADVTTRDLVEVLKGRGERWQFPLYAASLGGGEYFVAGFVKGYEETASRMPDLHFRPANAPGFLEGILLEGIDVLHERLRENPGDTRALQALAYRLFLTGKFAEALPLYEDLDLAIPGSIDVLEKLSVCKYRTGNLCGAVEALRGPRLWPRRGGFRYRNADGSELSRFEVNLGR